MFAFLKFTRFYESLQAGNIYMNSLKYYIDLEKESGVRGVGDALEAAHVFNDLTFEMRNRETGEVVFTGKSAGMNFRINGDEKRPVFCLFTLDADCFDIVDEDDEIYKLRLNIPEDQLEKMIQEFGEDLLLISPPAFLERLDATLNESGCSYRRDRVIYDDYSINSVQRLDSYKSQSTEIYFWKDKFFENQREYRIVLTDTEIDEPLTVNIGDISDISTKVKASEFLKDLEVFVKK